jgi:carbamoyltransferase
MMARHGAKAAHYPEFDSLCATTAALLADGNIIGWFQGRMEYGPRALGNRSILADPRNADLWKTINTSVKFREEFRPFAPSVLSEDADTYFDLDGDSPYMLLVAHINQPFRKPLSTETIAMNIVERLMQVRSALPVITHVDYSARIQTVSRDTNQRFYDLIGAFRKLTGIGMVVNTSFNVRGEPLVCRPEEAYRCFMGTRMDYLVIGNHLFSKSDQPATQNWRAALADD